MTRSTSRCQEILDLIDRCLAEIGPVPPTTDRARRAPLPESPAR
jgi:hypothetical protein